MVVTNYLMIAILVMLFFVLVIVGRILSGMKRQGIPPDFAGEPGSYIDGRFAFPAVQPGIPPQVVAAISAAVASMEGGAFRIASVTEKARPIGRRSAWGQAGVARLTQPF